MAIGMGRMFGFHFRENFDFPYIGRLDPASSGAAGTSRCRPGFATTCISRSAGAGADRPERSAICCIVFAAVRALARRELERSWRGASFHGALVALEYLGLGRLLDALPRLAGRLYTLVALGFGWALFRAESLPKATSLWAAMVGNGDAAFAPPWHQMSRTTSCARSWSPPSARSAPAAGLTRMIDRVAAQAAAAALVCAALRVAALGVVLYASALVDRGDDVQSVHLFPVLKHDPEKWIPVFGKDHAQTWS